jgi:hypothetical protein
LVSIGAAWAQGNSIHIKRRILSISLLKYKSYQVEDAKDSPKEETYGIASYKIVQVLNIERLLLILLYPDA